MREEGGNRLKKPDYRENSDKLIEDGKNIYADDVIPKATETKQIYGKLESFGQAGNYRDIGINWGGNCDINESTGRGNRGNKEHTTDKI